MEITSFKISTDKKNLELVISDAATLTSLILFTNKTYRDYNKAIDLTSKLTGESVENITINLADLKQSYLDGLYFIQAENISEISTAIAASLSKYKECNIKRLASLDLCDECLKEVNASILVVEAQLTALIDAITCGYIEEAFNIIRSLDKYCSDDCKSCGEYNNSNDINYFNTNTNL